LQHLVQRLSEFFTICKFRRLEQLRLAWFSDDTMRQTKLPLRVRFAWCCSWVVIKARSEGRVGSVSAATGPANDVGCQCVGCKIVANAVES